MAVTGAIADRVRGILPVSWDMLLKTPTFGEPSMRSTIDLVKEMVFGVVVAPTAEATYPRIVVNFVAKLVALELITPAIDAWRNNPISLVTTGTNEQVAYSDPVAALEQLRKDLLEQTRHDAGIVEPLIGFTRISAGPRPLLNTINDDFLTPSPQEFPRPYRITERT